MLFQVAGGLVGSTLTKGVMRPLLPGDKGRMLLFFSRLKQANDVPKIIEIQGFLMFCQPSLASLSTILGQFDHHFGPSRHGGGH